MNTKRNQLIAIVGGSVAVVAIIALVIFLVYARSTPQNNPFNLQMGQKLNADQTAVTDNGTSFSRTKPIYVIADYPEEGITRDHIAILSVISESSGKVVQKLEVNEDDSTKQIRMDLDNANWEPGIYEFTLARSGTMVGSINFSLHE
ncbi:hypothetical protein [Saccharibacillus sp. JS10]|uniref:hypothetical protein n=1 Tax=Saccharibacillus sp. JS10 TaxID=2950552 RepID=UPI00210984EA|nr:hypothetical protein [Saccharibacillus sp. JS10]MCQ4087089.1 hypothetical protein [Saccharibacillus sp. JS10]